MHIMTEGLADARWFKSSLSAERGGACVEGARLSDGSMAVRHSQAPQGPTFVFPGASWQAFMTAVKRGEFDLL